MKEPLTPDDANDVHAVVRALVALIRATGRHDATPTEVHKYCPHMSLHRVAEVCEFMIEYGMVSDAALDQDVLRMQQARVVVAVFFTLCHHGGWCTFDELLARLAQAPVAVEPADLRRALALLATEGLCEYHDGRFRASQIDDPQGAAE